MLNFIVNNLVLLQWFEKNVKAQTVLKAKDADTKEDERNPVWLSDKAGSVKWGPLKL